MSEAVNIYRELHRARKGERDERRIQAAQEYRTAAALAIQLGLELKRHSDQHYQLVWPNGAILNVYPGNRRLWSDPKRQPRPPRVIVSIHGDGWLNSVVKAAKYADGIRGR